MPKAARNTKPRRTPSAPERLAAEFAETVTLPDLTDEIDRHTKEWNALTEAVRRYSWAGSLTPKQASALYDKVADAVPAELQRALCDYSDAEGIQIAIGQQAGFLVGLQLGLRLRGGVR